MIIEANQEAVTRRNEPNGDGNLVKKRDKYRVIFLLKDSKSMPRDIQGESFKLYL